MPASLTWREGFWSGTGTCEGVDHVQTQKKIKLLKKKRNADASAESQKEGKKEKACGDLSEFQRVFLAQSGATVFHGSLYEYIMYASLDLPFSTPLKHRDISAKVHTCTRRYPGVSVSTSLPPY